MALEKSIQDIKALQCSFIKSHHNTCSIPGARDGVHEHHFECLCLHCVKGFNPLQALIQYVSHSDNNEKYSMHFENY